MAVSTSARPSGAPFCGSTSTTSFAPAARLPVSAFRPYSAPSPPFTRTSAVPSSEAAAVPVFAISTNPPVSVPTWS